MLSEMNQRSACLNYIDELYMQEAYYLLSNSFFHSLTWIFKYVEENVFIVFSLI